MKISYSFLVITSVVVLLVSCDKPKDGDKTLQHSLDSVTRLNQALVVSDAVQSKEASNKKIVSSFYQELFGDKNSEAIDKYIGATYIQHNPALADGKEALKNAISIWFKDAPKEAIDIQHIGADGDLVYIHTKSQQGSKMVSVMDIFKLENGKITEHWDVMQEVPEKSANAHPMF